MKDGQMFFVKDLRFVEAVTQLLNTLPESQDYYYLRVELRDSEADSLIGVWSDELGRKDWFYQQAE